MEEVLKVLLVWLRAVALASWTLVVVIPALAGDLRILLVNDDGIAAEGIQTLKERLEGAGHDVTVVAPDGSASGSSAASFQGEAFVAAPFDQGDVLENEYAVSRVTQDGESISPIPATPIDCLVAASLLLESPPDLVVSGINARHNTGQAAQFSGTVGGAFGASTKLSPFGPLPAIAVSLEQIFFSDPETPSPAFEKAYGDAADFVVDLIARLARSAAAYGGALLPGGVFLNINYPARPLEGVRGTRIRRQGDAYLVRFDDGGGPFVVRAVRGLAAVVDEDPVTGAIELQSLVELVDPNEGERHGDTEALVSGYITIVPMEGNYTAAPRNRLRVVRRLGYAWRAR